MVDDIKQRSIYVIIAYSALLLTFVSANCPKPALSENTRVVPLRSDVNLTCPGCHGQMWWSRANRTTTLQHGTHLALTSVGYEDEDNYTCYDDAGAPACTVQLLVEDDIEEPKISCYIRYPTHNITCDWQTTRELRPHATVKLIAWKVDKNHGENVCSYAPSTRKFSCSVPYDEGNNERHTLSLCVIGRTDRKSSNTVESKGEGLVRPDPPINVTVTPLEEQPYKLRVSWLPTEPWLSDFYPLQYQVQYWVEGVPHVSNGTTLAVSYVINDALARRRHVVRVRAKEEFYGSWSAWSEEKVGTPWSAGNEEEETHDSTDFPEFIMTSAEDENPENEKPRSSPVPHYAWAVAGVSFVLVLLLILGILMRIREVKLVKLKGGLLRAFLRPARSGPTLPQSLTAAPLLVPPGPPPDGVTVTVPQTAD